MFPKKKVLVVRTESMWDDMKDLDFQLGGSGSFGPSIDSVLVENRITLLITKTRTVYYLEAMEYFVVP